MVSCCPTDPDKERCGSKNKRAGQRAPHLGPSSLEAAYQFRRVTRAMNRMAELERAEREKAKREKQIISDQADILIDAMLQLPVEPPVDPRSNDFYVDILFQAAQERPE